MSEPGVADERPQSILLTPFLPLPGGSGPSLRAWSWLVTLCLTTRVVVLCSQRAGQRMVPADYPATVVWIGSEIEVPQRTATRTGRLLPFLALFTRAVVRGWPQPLPSLIETVEPHIDSSPMARIVVFRLYMHDVGMALCRRFPQAELHIDLDDLESETRVSVAGALLRLGRRREALTMLLSAIQYFLIERTISGPYKFAYLASETDVGKLRHRIAPIWKVWPNAIPHREIAEMEPDADVVRLLFVGTLNYAPNEESVAFLARSLVPKLRTALQRPWRLVVVGRAPPESLRRLVADVPEIELIADANDDELAVQYARATAALIPLRAGGGTKLKTIEAFAHRRPVIAMPEGVRGLSARPGEHYLEARTADEFVAAIVQLITDRDLAARLVVAAEGLVAAGTE